MAKPSKKVQLSVVMAVYENDRPDWFKQSLDSILTQTVLADDIVIVRDGTVSDNLESMLNRYENAHKEISILRLNKNIGAGQARNKGVDSAKNELVAVVDADDISLPNRFEEQLEGFRNKPELALLGGQISEFAGSVENIIGYRRVPTEYDAVKKFARLRSPINHVTIMFKKSAFLSVGGYPELTRSEDYYMVSSMLSKGLIVNNLDSVIVNYRINSDNIRRRKSWQSVRENIHSRREMYKMGALSLSDYSLSAGMQLLLFIIPSGLLGVLFNKALRSKT